MSEDTLPTPLPPSGGTWTEVVARFDEATGERRIERRPLSEAEALRIITDFQSGAGDAAIPPAPVPAAESGSAEQFEAFIERVAGDTDGRLAWVNGTPLHPDARAFLDNLRRERVAAAEARAELAWLAEQVDRVGYRDWDNPPPVGRWDWDQESGCWIRRD